MVWLVQSQFSSSISSAKKTMEESEAGFYKQAAFPVTQPRVSKHLKESKSTDPNRENIINENT